QEVMIALLIRHALISARDTLGQRAPVSLSDEGEAQARRLADRMRGRELAAGITSPLAPAVGAARGGGEAKQVPLIMDHALREVDVGEWENRTISDLSPFDSWKYFNTFRSGTRCPGGEMMIEVQARVVASLERLTREYGESTVAIVSHAD